MNGRQLEETAEEYTPLLDSAISTSQRSCTTLAQDMAGDQPDSDSPVRSPKTVAPGLVAPPNFASETQLFTIHFPTSPMTRANVDGYD